MTILVQTTEAEASAQKDALNAQFVSAGIDATLEAVVAQVNNWSMNSIPKARVVEFDAGDATKQNNFLQFSVTANTAEYAGVDFVTAWETEYSKVYP